METRVSGRADSSTLLAVTPLSGSPEVQSADLIDPQPPDSHPPSPVRLSFGSSRVCSMDELQSGGSRRQSSNEAWGHNGSEPEAADTSITMAPRQPMARLEASATERRRKGQALVDGEAERGLTLGDTMRGIIHKFLPDGAVAGDSTRFAAARGWISADGVHHDVLAHEAKHRAMVLYSERRAERFTNFKPSWQRQVAIVSIFPLVCFFFGVSVFALPFANVEDGAAANWAQFIALGYGAALVFQTPVALIKNLTKIPISFKQILLATIPGGVFTTVLAVSIAATIVYPFAFVPISCGFPGFLLTVALTYRTLPKGLRKFHRVKVQIITAVTVSTLTLVVMFCWAAHRLGFVALQDSQVWQPVFTLLLPIMKFTFRWIFAKVSLLVDPDLGPSLLFIVEYFNAIFVSTLMTDTTVLSGVLLVSYDIIGNLIHLYQLWLGYALLAVVKKGTVKMCCFSSDTPVESQTPASGPQLLAQLKIADSMGMIPSLAPIHFEPASKGSPMGHASSDVHHTARSADSEAGRAQVMPDLGTIAEGDSKMDLDEEDVSPLPTPRIDDMRTIVEGEDDEFEALSDLQLMAKVLASAGGSSASGAHPGSVNHNHGTADSSPVSEPPSDGSEAGPRPPVKQAFQSLDAMQVATPTPDAPPVTITEESLRRTVEAREKLEKALSARLEASNKAEREQQQQIVYRWRLRQSEMIMLAEFVEVMTPLQYGLFMLFGYYGYNNSSFVGLSDMPKADFENAINWVGLLFVIELAGFVLLFFLLYRLQGWSPLRQLAFVLKEHWWLLGSSVVLMFVYTVALIVKQNGCDFTFKFDWM